jgi:FdrA protein
MSSTDPDGPVTRTLVRRSAYRDSVALLSLARELRADPGVREAAALMATEANKALLAGSGLLDREAAAAGPNDLVIAIRALAPVDAERACAHAETLLAARRQRADASGRQPPRTIESARRRLPGANLALISVPGPFAAAEAEKALRLGLHVMLFSDNVALDDELRLKRMARDRGLLLMGPDCGTAYVNGTPLGFANAVPRGRIGIVAASGTGLQQVATLLAESGEGISQAFGVGGRDLSETIGGVMTLAALDALAADRATELVLVVAKPPAPAARERVMSRLRGIGKPVVVGMLGSEVAANRDSHVITVGTLEDAALAASVVSRGQRWAPSRPAISSGDAARVLAARRALGPGQRSVRGLYAGGTLAHEAVLILEGLLGPVATNLRPASDGAHRVLDLGADEYTLGRAHPMLDSTVRSEAIVEVGKEGDAAVLLLDVVLGQGAAADPAGDVAPAIEAARDVTAAHGRSLAVVASVIGTRGDPQGLAGQIARLEAAGAWVLPSNARAARVAACIAGGEDVLARLAPPSP